MTRRDAERIARMRAVWQEAMASDFELTTARQRYLLREKQRSSPSRSLWFEFGLGLGVAALLLVSARWSGLLSPQTPSAETLISAGGAPGVSSNESLALDGLTPSGVSSGSVAAAGSLSLIERSIKHVAFRASLERGGEESAVLPGVPYVVAVGESVRVRLGAEVQTVVGPSVLEFQLDPERASGWRLVIASGSSAEAGGGAASGGARDTKLPSRTRRAEEPREASQPPLRQAAPSANEVEAVVPSPAPQESRAVQEAQAAASWSEVAEALRAGEQQRAEAALQRLSQGAEVATRDSARLALAQLWLSQGRGDEARGVLRSLSEAGSTAFIRRRAAELLDGR